MNIKLLRQIKREILKRPTQFNMNWWFQKRDSLGNRAGGCGTAACIAGWAVAIAGTEKGETIRLAEFSGGSFFDTNTPDSAKSILDISDDHAHRLFDRSNWPMRYLDERANTSMKVAKLAAARIEHFIKTKGRE